MLRIPSTTELLVENSIISSAVLKASESWLLAKSCSHKNGLSSSAECRLSITLAFVGRSTSSSLTVCNNKFRRSTPTASDIRPLAWGEVHPSIRAFEMSASTSRGKGWTAGLSADGMVGVKGDTMRWRFITLSSNKFDGLFKLRDEKDPESLLVGVCCAG
jgi:hypothetical protein